MVFIEFLMNKTVNSQKIVKKFSKLLKKLGAIRISMGKLPTKFQPKLTNIASPKKSNIENHARRESRLGSVHGDPRPACTRTRWPSCPRARRPEASVHEDTRACVHGDPRPACTRTRWPACTRARRHEASVHGETRPACTRACVHGDTRPACTRARWPACTLARRHAASMHEDTMACVHGDPRPACTETRGQRARGRFFRNFYDVSFSWGGIFSKYRAPPKSHRDVSPSSRGGIFLGRVIPPHSASVRRSRQSRVGVGVTHARAC